MHNSKDKYFVVETKHFPNCFQVKNGWDNDNSFCNFFPKQDSAQKEADRRNK